jgi:hypothetical protein
MAKVTVSMQVDNEGLGVLDVHSAKARESRRMLDQYDAPRSSPFSGLFANSASQNFAAYSGDGDTGIYV